LILTHSKANVLIDKDEHARLTGFGQTIVIRGDDPVLSLQDPDPTVATTWAAPELSEGGVVTKEGDIFTFAIVAIEVCTRRVFEESCSAYLL
jgi:hypothetical protein